MTSGESPILARSPATGLSGVVKPAGEAAFNLPRQKRTILRMGLNPAYDVERAETILSRVVTAVLENEAPAVARPLERLG